MFRFRSQLVFVAAAFAAIFCEVMPIRAAGAPRAQSVAPAAAQTLTGVDVLESTAPDSLAGVRLGLITNETGVDSGGRRTIDVLARVPGLKLVALFSPEHGLLGRADAPVANARDEKTGLPIYSLYGETRHPTDEMLSGIDVLIFDIQDAGVRFYTFVTTMAYCMEEAAKHHIRFVVLDRPNPLGGVAIEGPVLDADRTSFTGYFRMPVRYGMTMGELARMFNSENKIGADLQVVAMKNWGRSEAYDQTGLAWIAPSPNLRTLNAEFLYPGIEILQAGGVSVGRGTDAPFEILGAPWIRADEFLAALGKRKIAGVTFASARFTPTDGLYKGQACQGVTIAITNRSALQPMRMGIELADLLHRMYPEKFQVDKIVELLASQSTVDRLKRGDAAADIVAGWSADIEKFRAMRAKYLLYE
jgi:uncharacterized protein YbbC (DUF1343 family)